MFKHKKDGRADIPSEVRCKLMRVFREKMMTVSPDSSRSYFDFGASKTGFLQLPKLDTAEWDSLSGYTFNIWIYICQSRKSSAYSSSVEKKPDRVLLYSICAHNMVGVEVRLIFDTPEGANNEGDKNAFIEIRSRNNVQGGSPAGEWATVKCSLPSHYEVGKWHMVSIVHEPVRTRSSRSSIPLEQSPLGKPQSDNFSPLKNSLSGLFSRSPLSSPGQKTDTLPNGRFACYVDGMLSCQGEVPYPLVRTKAHNGLFASCIVGGGFEGKIERITMYSGIVKPKAINFLFKRGMGFKYPPLSSRATTPISLTLSCNRTVYETSYGLDVLWSFSAEHVLNDQSGECFKAGLEGEEKKFQSRLVSEWKSLGSLTLSRVVQARYIRQTRRCATMMGDIKACVGTGTWAQSSLFLAGGMKVILPLFAFLGRESPGDTAKGISLGEHDEGKEAILLLHSLMYGAGGLRLRKELYEMRGAAVIASLMTGNSSHENVDRGQVGSDKQYNYILTDGVLEATFATTAYLLENDSPLADDFIRHLLLDLDLWRKAPATVQMSLCSRLLDFTKHYPQKLREVISVQMLLDQIRMAYCRPLPSNDRILSPAESAKCADNFTSLVANLIPFSKTIASVTEANLRPLSSTLNAILGFVRSCSGSTAGKTAAARGLKIINTLLDQKEYTKKVYVSLQGLGGAAEVVPLVGRPGEEARAAALGLIGRLLLLSRSLASQNDPMANLNESKADLIVRLMSASLIELRGTEALDMMNCGNLMCKDVFEVIDGHSDEKEGLLPGYPDNREVASGDWIDLRTNVSVGSGQSQRKERRVTASTITAAVHLVIGDWNNDSELSEDEVAIALPEGLLLLLGLLTAPHAPPEVVEKSLSRLSLWLKMKTMNSVSIIKCVHWQRWFLGMYISLFTSFKRELVARKESTDHQSTRFESEAQRNMHYHVIQTMACDALSSLYSHLTLLVKKGCIQMRATVNLLNQHNPVYSYPLIVNFMAATLNRIHSELLQTFRTNGAISEDLYSNVVHMVQFVEVWVFPSQAKYRQNAADNNVEQTDTFFAKTIIENVESIVLHTANIFSILTQAKYFRTESDSVEKAGPFVRVFCRRLAYLPSEKAMLIVLDRLQHVAINICGQNASAKSKHLLLGIISELQMAMVMRHNNTKTVVATSPAQSDSSVDFLSEAIHEVEKENDSIKIIQRISLSTLAIVNNIRAGLLGMMVEGWDAEMLSAAMRPQLREQPETSAQRVFDLLAPALIKETSRQRKQIISYRQPGRFGQGFVYVSPGKLALANNSTVAKSQQILSRQLKISTTDVSELQKRQSSRSDLDRQRFVIFIKGMETNRSQTYQFFHNRIWPALNLGIYNPWAAPLTQKRYFILSNSEEHLFSRRRRRLIIDPHGDGQKASSYALFAREGNRTSSSMNSELETEKLLASVSVRDAMKQQSAEDEGEHVQGDPADDIVDEGDGWEEEDNEWDEMARARDAAARVAVRTRRPSKSKRRTTASPSISSRFSRASTISTDNQGSNVETILCRDDRVVFVRPTMSAKGSVVLTNRAIIFNPDLDVNSPSKSEANEEMDKQKSNNDPLQQQRRISNRKRRWRLENIRRMYLRRYCLVSCAFELFVNGGEVVFFVFKGDPQVERRDSMYTALYELLSRRIQRFSQPIGLSPRRFFDQSGLTRAWQNRSLSNFDYLMALNTLAGRSYTDLSQYPVFPWILTDYKSETIDLSRPEVYRDLSLPMGALNAERLKEFQQRYESFDDDHIPKFLYGSHYSTAAGVVLYFLVRLEPFTQLHVETQDGHFDVPDRLFSSVVKTWDMCYTSLSEVKEIIPEFYSLPNFLRNESSCPLGTMQDGSTVNDVQLPPWANNSPEKFIEIMRSALESEYVSENLHKWIDLIFGYKQRGQAAIENNNVFYYLTYEGAVDLNEITDPTVRHAMELQIEHFGQCPTQLLLSPHPKRGRHITVPRPLYTSLLGFCFKTFLSKQQQTMGGNQSAAPYTLNAVDLGALQSSYPGVTSLIKLGFDPMHALIMICKNWTKHNSKDSFSPSRRDSSASISDTSTDLVALNGDTDTVVVDELIRQSASDLGQGGQYTRESTFSDLRAVVYAQVKPDDRKQYSGPGSIAVIAVRCLLHTVEVVDNCGRLTSFSLHRQDPRNMDGTSRNYGDGFTPLVVENIETELAPDDVDRFTVPSLSTGFHSPDGLSRLSKLTKWSSGGYILATGGANNCSIEFWVLERNSDGRMFIDGSMAINGHEAVVTTIEINREIILTGDEDGLVMLWHLLPGSNNRATLSNRPFQILRGHTSEITSANINKTCQTVVTVSSGAKALIHRSENPPPNGQHEIVGDLPAMKVEIPPGHDVQHVIVGAAGYIVTAENQSSLALYDLNGRRISSADCSHLDRFRTGPSENSNIVALERSARGHVFITAHKSSVALWSTKTLSELRSYDLSAPGQGILNLSLNLSEEFMAVGCDNGVVIFICLPNFRDGSDPAVANPSRSPKRLQTRVRTASQAVVDGVAEQAKSAVSNAFNYFKGWGNKKS
jgi:hypothetical protein